MTLSLWGIAFALIFALLIAFIADHDIYHHRTPKGRRVATTICYVSLVAAAVLALLWCGAMVDVLCKRGIF